MFIQTETTPNPLSLKFIPGRDVSPTPVAFNNSQEAEISPLAQALFRNKDVKAVFFGLDFITITKTPDANWELLKPDLLLTMMEHFSANIPLFKEDHTQKNKFQNNPDDEAIIAQIKEIIENRVRPAVADDGGDITFVGYKEGVVYLEMHGACSGCPSSTVTLKNGVENMLKHYVPEVVAVETYKED